MAVTRKCGIYPQCCWASVGQYGYSKMTVEDIAHEAGIGKGTLYLYFPEQARSRDVVVHRSNEVLQAKLRKIVDSDFRRGESAADPGRTVMHRFDGRPEPLLRA